MSVGLKMDYLTKRRSPFKKFATFKPIQVVYFILHGL